MAFNFLPCDRDQPYLLPPSLTDWLPEDHLAFFLLDAVKEMDLHSFYVGYREDGWGAPAFEPAMMVSLLLYAYCIGERSSRRIERRCQEDIAFRVITANSAPDHSTIARFRQANEQALSACFTEVLRLCAAAGLVRVGVVALDGTKVEANASLYANRAWRPSMPRCRGCSPKRRPPIEWRTSCWGRTTGATSCQKVSAARKGAFTG
jgi:transposase